jgi:hypothetical protein
MSSEAHEVVTEEWVTFPGGELEGKRPKALCSACRDALKGSSTAGRSTGRASAVPGSRLLCFDCYRADLARTRALKEAGELDTASVARFQTQLPFEPVNQPRLDSLKAARATAREVDAQGIGQYASKRRRAQIQARHALQTIAAGLNAHGLTPTAKAHAMAAAIHAAELQLPEAWLPYVVSR